MTTLGKREDTFLIRIPRKLTSRLGNKKNSRNLT